LDFSGRHIAIVGTAHGSGADIARAFIEAGAAVATDTAVERAKAVQAIDYGKSTDIAAWFDALEAALGPVDTLVLSAKPVTTGSFLTMPAETFVAVVQQELIWFGLMMQEASKRMSRRGFGRIVGLCSMSGKTGVHHNVAPFAAAKGGLIALSRALAAEVAATGVTVNMIANALMEQQVSHHPPERQAELAKGIPVGRFGKAREAAQAVLYLASQDAGFITGETLNFSGGRFMD
jgi:3-oxoacyl-[acyl-carrier protein] reductase